MKLCMIGTGYVGLVSGVCFSDLGNDVICVDKDLKKINNLKKGIVPIYEPGLEELVLKNYKNKRLNFSTNLKESVKKSDIVFICVGTPTKKNSNSADLSQVYAAAKEISKSVKKFKIETTKYDENKKLLVEQIGSEKLIDVDRLIVAFGYSASPQDFFINKGVHPNLLPASISELLSPIKNFPFKEIFSSSSISCNRPTSGFLHLQLDSGACGQKAM